MVFSRSSKTSHIIFSRGQEVKKLLEIDKNVKSTKVSEFEVHVL